jgi:hypothetical protein
MLRNMVLSAAIGQRFGSGYSAAIPAAPATCRNAASMRASKPGLFGSNGRSMSVVMPAAAAARKMRSRRSRNFVASTGFAKSATFTAQALCAAVHSGDSVSGASLGWFAFFDISGAFAGVGSSQGHNAQPIISQNINENVQPTIQKTARDKALFVVVKPRVDDDLRTLPVETGGIRKMQPAVRKILSGLFVVPFKQWRHSGLIHTTSCRVYDAGAMFRKLYKPVDFRHAPFRQMAKVTP